MAEIVIKGTKSKYYHEQIKNIYCMKLKERIQEILINYCGIKLFRSYVAKRRLEEDVVSRLILNHMYEHLIIYMSYHLLSSRHIQSILMDASVNEAMLTAVRKYTLAEKQQLTLVQKNNVLLLEAYLCPNGIFDAERRFQTQPEYYFIYGMVKSEKLIGTEIFKTYVDNCFRTLLTENLLRLLVQNENAFATRYILQKVRIKKEMEELFIRLASDELIRYYINEHELGSDQAQLLLVQEHFELAKLHFNKYKLRMKPQQLYHEMRNREAEKKKNGCLS